MARVEVFNSYDEIKPQRNNPSKVSKNVLLSRQKDVKELATKISSSKNRKNKG